MNISEIIDSMVAARVEKAIAEMFTGQMDKAGIASKVSDYREKGENARSVAAKRVYRMESGETDQPTPRRKRGRNPRVGYVIVPRRGRFVAPTLFETARITFDAIRKAGRPISNMELEKVTGLKRKTVESTVWYLRRHDADGAVVKDGKGLVTAQPLEA